MKARYRTPAICQSVLSLGLVLCLTCTGCSSRAAMLTRQTSKDTQVLNEAVDTFFAALDARDAETIKGLFSPSVLAEDTDMDDQIAKLMELYPGPTDINRCKMAGASKQVTHGSRVATTFGSFPVVSRGVTYWCYVSIMYENDNDPNQIGVKQLYFLTADEYCGIMDELWDWPEEYGLVVCAGRTLEREVRCIEDSLFQYTPMEPLERAEVEAFLDGREHCSYADFVARFGEPSIDRNHFFYELPPENGEPLYLRVSDGRSGEIQSISVVGTFQWREYLWRDVEFR